MAADVNCRHLPMSDLFRALNKLDLKDGDVVFFDASAIETSQIQDLCIPGEEGIHFNFVPVFCRPGQTPENVVFAMTRGEIEFLLKEIDARRT